MNLEELDELLSGLKFLKNDHRNVEAKEARRALPEDIDETISAFANSDGGIILFGVREGKDKTFDVTGVEDPSRMETNLQDECNRMEPAVRAVIDTIRYPNREAVVVAVIPPTPRNARPCHKSGTEPTAASFIRVADVNRQMNIQEVLTMISERTPIDYSVGEVAEGASLDKKQVEDFLSRVRSNEPEELDGVVISDNQLLMNLHVLRADGKPTLAGFLSMGEKPTLEAGGRLSFMTRPKNKTETEEEPYVSSDVNGTIGAIFDKCIALVHKELKNVIVSIDGANYNDLDVPKRAIREVLSNALIHRSFAPNFRGASVVVKVSEIAVEITSPGVFPAYIDPSTIGVEPSSYLRNNALNLICSNLETPNGMRITEHQASGIYKTDIACRNIGTMLALIVEGTISIRVILVRGILDTDPAREILRKAGAPIHQDYVRLIAVALKLNQIKQDYIDLKINALPFDPQLAARALSSSDVYAASILLGELEKFGVLRRIRIGAITTWVLLDGDGSIPSHSVPIATTHLRPKVKSKPKHALAPAKAADGDVVDIVDRVSEIVIAIGESEHGELSPGQIALALGVTSTETRSKWINKALFEKLIRTDSDELSSYKKFYLTNSGKARFRTLQDRKNK